jgi:hypothetical protein
VTDQDDAKATEVAKYRALETFANRLRILSAERRGAEDALASIRADIVRVARAAHVAGMTERAIARAAQVTPPAAHKWVKTS